MRMVYQGIPPALADKRILLIGTGLAIVWWIFESAIHAVIFNEGSFLQQLFSPDPHELWMRTLTFIVIILFSVSAQILFNRQKRAEEEVRKTHAELDQVFQTAADGMRVVDRDFNMLRMNDTFLNLASVNREDAAGRKCYDVFSGPLCRTSGCPLTRILAGETHVTEEVEKTAADGRTIPCIVTAVPFRSPDGGLIGIVEDFRDITELKHNQEDLKRHRDHLQELVEQRTAELTERNGQLQREIAERVRVEEALRESEERHRLIFVSSHDAIMTLEPPAWRFTLCNPATVAMFRAKDDTDFISKEPWELSPERQPTGRLSRETAKEMITEALREGSHLFEWTHRRMDGTEFPATVLLTRFEWKGQSILQATVRDITEQKLAEKKVRESNERYLAYIKEAVMRLRTPVEVVQQNLAALAEEMKGEGPDYEEIYSQLLLQVKNAEQIRQNIIDLNKTIVDSFGDISPDSRKFLVE